MMNRNISILIAILLIGLAARGIGITSESLWCDEISSLNHVEQDFPAFFDSLLNVDVHPPLYFILLRGWCRLFGANALSARLLSLVLGLLCLPAAFSLGRRLLDERASLMAALFLALSPRLHPPRRCRPRRCRGFRERRLSSTSAGATSASSSTVSRPVSLTSSCRTLP